MSSESRITRNRAAAATAGFAPSVAVTRNARGETVVTRAAVNVAAMLPAASATVLPDTSSPNRTVAPGVNPDPLSPTFAPAHRAGARHRDPGRAGRGGHGEGDRGGDQGDEPGLHVRDLPVR